MGKRFIFSYKSPDFSLRTSVINASLVQAKVTVGKDEKIQLRCLWHSYNSKKKTHHQKKQAECMRSNVHLSVLNVTVVKSKIPQSQQIQITFCREVGGNRQKNTRSTSVSISCISVYKEQWPFCFLFKLHRSAESWHRNTRSLIRLLATGYFTNALLLQKLKQHKDQSHWHQAEPMFSYRSESTLLLSYSEIVSLLSTYKSDKFSHLLHYCLFHFYTFYRVHMRIPIQ